MGRRLIPFLAAGTIAALAAARRRRWDRGTARDVARLHEDTAAGATGAPDLTGLPAPVARYFEFTLPPGASPDRWVRFRQSGELRDPSGPWRRFTAIEHIAADPPGFVWDARVRLAPLLSMRVRDSALAGVGAGQVSLAGLIPIAAQRGGPELGAAALHRLLAESVWLPVLLLPGSGVTWEPMDDRTARAALRVGDLCVSLEFGFGERGEIVRAFTPARYRTVKGGFAPTPWACRYADYARLDGAMVPQTGEVDWVLPDGPVCCFRGRVADAEFGAG